MSKVALGPALIRFWVLLGLTWGILLAPAQAESLQVLFLGDQGPHRPGALNQVLSPALQEFDIELTYTEQLDDLNLENLRRYDGLLIYANIDRLPEEQESALLEYVAGGGGFIPLHCASFCFRNSPAYVELVGAQFQTHGTGTFQTEIVQPQHPIMSGFGGFESWDETYVHAQHNERNRIVLEQRVGDEQADGRQAEPWTWVRTHGKGRVFYTAWGHDERTWKHSGFHNLVARGIKWACGEAPSSVVDYRDLSLFPIPEIKELPDDLAPFEYVDVGPKIPNYVAGESWGTQGDVQTKMQKPLSPKESLKHYVTPEGFRLELFVSEPDIQGKPIAMNWDEHGRLWVCETIDYPNELQPPEEGRDRIRICEDTDGDGRADQFTVFAENLSIPTTLEFCRGGVIVQAGVETLFLCDTDGDDHADERHTLITGWEMGDTHGGVSNFMYGLDNRYWAMQGYNDSEPKFAGGEHRGFRQGPFAFHVDQGTDSPQVTDVEFIRSTTNNSWGLGISEEGLIFCSTANRAPSFFVPIPNRYYERVRGWTPSLLADEIAEDHLFDPITDKVRQVDHHGGFTAGAGHALYTARNYPASWWNRVAFVCGPTGHLVASFVIEPDGATFRSDNKFNLVASDDEWAAPIMAEVGPDGNVWIIDWYNYVVQHNPTPQGFETGKGNAYVSDLRDKTHGRIYRLVYDKEGTEQSTKGSQPTAPLKLDSEQPQGLVQALQHPNRLWRRHAQRLLVERGEQDVVPELIELVRDPSVDITGNNPGVIHALWTLHGLGALDSAEGDAFQAVTAALQHESPGVRRNASLVLPAAEESTSALLASGLLRDAEPQVVLAALMGLADMPASDEAGKVLGRLAIDSEVMGERYIREGIICAAAVHAGSFLNAILTASMDDAEQDASRGERSRRGTSESNATIEAIRVIAEHTARSRMDGDTLEGLLKMLAEAPASRVQAIIEGWAEGWPADAHPKLSETAEQALVELIEELPSQSRGYLVRLANSWGSERLASYAREITLDLIETIEDPEQTIERRQSAATELVGLMGGDQETIVELVELINPQMPPAVSSHLVSALRNAESEAVADELIAAWSSFTPQLRADTVSVLLARTENTRKLLDAMEEGIITASDLSLDQKQSLRSHPNRRLRSAARDLLSASGGSVNADRQKVIEAYMEATEKGGDVAAGKQLFTKNCANCHQHSGEGTEVGPDLTGMAVHPKEELLIHILDPNRSVEGNFRRYTLLTLDGQVLSGMLAAESLSALEIIDAEGKRQSIPREDIDRITSSNISLMPEGFEQQLDRKQMTDLLAFLTKKGKYVPLQIAGVATATSDRALFSNSPSGPDRLIFDSWTPKVHNGVPFRLVDPLDGSRPNIVLLNGPNGPLPPTMPREVSLVCNLKVKQLHLLSGVSGWGYPYSRDETTSMIVRLHYQDGETEDHPLINGQHFADYIRRVDVPKSEFAFDLRGQQIRYLSVVPRRDQPLTQIDLVKGDDASAPIVMAITAEQAD